jgi:hypothetical protein
LLGSVTWPQQALARLHGLVVRRDEGLGLDEGAAPDHFIQWFGTNTDVIEQKLAKELPELNERLQEIDRDESLF